MLAAAPMRIGLIARNAGIRVPSATEQVTKLAAAGLVERVPSDTDARVVEVRLTEEGRRTLKAANLRRNREMARAFDSLSPRERQAINVAIPAIEKLNVALSP